MASPARPPPHQSASPQRGAATTVDPIVFPAIKYVYDLSRKTWKEVHSMIRVLRPHKPFEAGGMRLCFDVEDIDEEGGATGCVGKFFKKDIPDVVEVDYFNEAMAQCMSEEFAQNFNRHPAIQHKVSFLMCYVVRVDPKVLPQTAPLNSFFSFRTQDTHQCLFVMEFKFRGSFTKYNNNFGEVYDKPNPGMTVAQTTRRQQILQTAEAFSHFTLQESGGSFLVCDLQGVEDFFTDPQIHTEDGKGLGMGNMGAEGIGKWATQHTCNAVCKALQLQSIDAQGRPTGRPSPLTGGVAYRELQEKMMQPLEGRASYRRRGWNANMSEEEMMRLAIEASLKPENDVVRRQA